MPEECICKKTCKKFAPERHRENPNYVRACTIRDFPETPQSDEGLETTTTRNDTSNSEFKEILLPAYIVHSHKFKTYKFRNDVTQEYKIQLKSPDGKNLFMNDHHDLLQVMTQYVYYKKLCKWIKREMREKRLELLEAARHALIDARDGENLCICDPKATKKKELTDIEKEFLARLIRTRTRAQIAALYVPSSAITMTKAARELQAKLQALEQKLSISQESSFVNRISSLGPHKSNTMQQTSLDPKANEQSTNIPSMRPSSVSPQSQVNVQEYRTKLSQSIFGPNRPPAQATQYPSAVQSRFASYSFRDVERCYTDSEEDMRYREKRKRKICGCILVVFFIILFICVVTIFIVA